MSFTNNLRIIERDLNKIYSEDVFLKCLKNKLEKSLKLYELELAEAAEALANDSSKSMYKLKRISKELKGD